MDHSTVDFEPDEAGWWRATCECGWYGPGPYPSAEDAADALMEHAFRTGWMARATIETAAPQTDA